MNKIYFFLKNFFDLESDRADYHEIITGIEKGVEIKGTNLWILMFAIMVASVGLNVNSTAVVIGAMLISPLMGPIVGVGLGLGTFDLPLIKKASVNLAVTVSISVLTSALYFILSPLYEAQSELLARTQPTIWDVLIAFFGGLAGAVGLTRKEKSNVIPGVAIATALMPPLCTAGYGLATLNGVYFFGAFYLFFINSVFISVSAFLIIRLLKFPYKTWVDPLKQRRIRTYVWIIALITVVPSVYLATGIVRGSIFKQNANAFIQNEFLFDNSKVIETNLDPSTKTVEVFLYGEKLNSFQVEDLKTDMEKYGLKGANLLIRQNEDELTSEDLKQMRSGIIEDLYSKNEEVIKNKNEQILLLEKELSRAKRYEEIHGAISKEIEAQYPSIKKCAVNEMILHENGKSSDTLTLVYLSGEKRLSNLERNKLEAWLKVRLQSEKLKLIFE